MSQDPSGIPEEMRNDFNALVGACIAGYETPEGATRLCVLAATERATGRPAYLIVIAVEESNGDVSVFPVARLIGAHRALIDYIPPGGDDKQACGHEGCHHEEEVC